MTVQSQTAKSGPYAGAGTKGPFPVDFRFLENGHLRVIKTDAAGVEQTLVMGADYSVAGAENQAGGSVTLTADLLAGYTLVVLRKVPATQLADYVEGDSFPAESHENALDKLTMIAQQLAEEVDRAAKLPVTSAADAQQLTSNIMRLANSAANIDVVAGNVDSVNAAADNMPAIIDALAQAQAAAESATAADQSAQDAAASYDAFDDRYLGAKSSDPTTDNDGNPLLTGALYWNTTSDSMRVYSGTAWGDVAQGVSFPYQILSGTGSQTAFTLNSAPGSLGALEVFIAGVRQYPVTNYTLSGVTLTFGTAPPSGTNNIFARWVTTQAINVPADGTVGVESLKEGFVLPVSKGGTGSDSFDTVSEVNALKDSFAQLTISGIATLTAMDNKIVMTGVVGAVGLKKGDVVEIDATAISYKKLHTAESLLNANEIVVNYEHCGGRGNGSLKLPDYTGPVTIKRIAKWYNAAEGLGQEEVDVTALRASGVLYQNTTNRNITATLEIGNFTTLNTFIVDGMKKIQQQSGSGIPLIGWVDIGVDKQYSLSVGVPTHWKERR